MAINFPNSPTDGQIYAQNGKKWIWNDTFGSWDSYNPVYLPETGGTLGQFIISQGDPNLPTWRDLQQSDIPTLDPIKLNPGQAGQILAINANGNPAWMDLDQKPAVTDLQQEDKNLQELAIAMAIALG